MKLVALDKHGWPVELFVGRPITNFIRLLLHTDRVITAAEWQRRERRASAPTGVTRSAETALAGSGSARSARVARDGEAGAPE